LIATVSGRQLVIELVESLALGVEVDVSVEVHGHFDRAVANDLHDDARVDAEAEQQGDAGVAKAVKGDTADAVVAAEVVPNAGEVAGFEWGAPAVPKM
jgi:hypothetical protein